MIIGKKNVVGIDPALTARVEALEETSHEYEIYESVGSGTGGNVTIPAHGTIILDQYPGAADCLLVQTDPTTGRPIDEVVRTSGGSIVTATLSGVGSYTLSGTPSSYPVAIVFQVALQEQYKEAELPNARILSETVPITFSTGLTSTSNVVTNDLLTGKGSGQTVVGGTDSGGSLTLSSTAHGTKGKIKFGTSAYDETTGNIGIGTQTPGNSLDISKSTNSGADAIVPTAKVANTLPDQGDGVSSFNFSNFTTSSGNGAVLGFLGTSHASDSVYGSCVRLGSVTNHGVRFHTNNSTKLVLTEDGRLFGTSLHNNPGPVTGAVNQYICSGTYTPSVAPYASQGTYDPVPYQCPYIRVGNVGQFSGRVGIRVDTTQPIAIFDMSYPIPSNIGDGALDVMGIAHDDNGYMWFIQGGASGRLRFFSPSSVRTVTLQFSIMYVIK